MASFGARDGDVASRALRYAGRHGESAGRHSGRGGHGLFPEIVELWEGEGELGTPR